MFFSFDEYISTLPRTPRNFYRMLRQKKPFKGGRQFGKWPFALLKAAVPAVYKSIFCQDPSVSSWDWLLQLILFSGGRWRWPMCALCVIWVQRQSDLKPRTRPLSLPASPSLSIITLQMLKVMKQLLHCVPCRERLRSDPLSNSECLFLFGSCVMKGRFVFTGRSRKGQVGSRANMCWDRNHKRCSIWWCALHMLVYTETTPIF